MQTKLLLCSLVFTAGMVSCNSKEENHLTATVSGIASPTTATASNTVYAGEAIYTPDLSNAFVQSITQTFTAAANEVSVIKARKGLKVTVDPSALEKEDGSPVDGIITLRIAELTTSEDLFKSNAATMSDSQLLASGGSYFVGMECNGQKLRIKNNASIHMDFPKIKQAENMELFYGDRDTKGNMNWVKAGQPLQKTASFISETFIPFILPYPDTEDKWGKGRFPLYDSVNTRVGYEDKKVTLQELVNLLQQKGIDKNIDTVTVRRSVLVDRSLQGLLSGYEMKDVKRYRLISSKELQVEKDSFDFKTKANDLARIEWYKQSKENNLPLNCKNIMHLQPLPI